MPVPRRRRTPRNGREKALSIGTVCEAELYQPEQIANAIRTCQLLDRGIFVLCAPPVHDCVDLDEHGSCVVCCRRP